MLLTLPEQIARFKKMNPHLASTYNRVGWPTYVDQTPAAPPERPVYAITVGDEDAARAIDPCWATIFALWASPAGPFEIRVGDVLVATIAPTDAGVAPTGNLSLDVYELLVAQHGTDDTGEVSGAHDDVGRAAMLEVLHGLAELSSGTPHFRGEDEVRIRQAEVVGRARGMSDEALEQVTGRKYAPKKGLIPTCAVAKVLDAKKHAADEAAAQAKKLADAAVVEAMRPRTFGEIGVDALRVPKARLRTDSIPLSMLYEETDHRVIGVRTTLGYEIPPTFAEDSITSLTGDAIVPAGMRPASEPTAESIGLVKTLRARHGKDLYLGAIPRQMFVDAGHDRGRALAATHAGVLLSTSAATLWRHTWLAELLVRGLLIRPDVATKILGEAVDRESERRAPRMLSIPSTHHAREVALDGTEFAKPSEGRRDILNPSAPPGRLSSGTWLGDLTASAMDAGHVSAGALLEPTTFTPTTKPSVKKGK